MAISARAVGAWAYAASGSVTTTLPTHATDDMLLVRVAYKSSAIATCAASTATSGWTKLDEWVGTTNSGNGSGSVNVAVFWKEATSASETNPTITFSQAVTQVGHVGVAYQKGAGETWDTPFHTDSGGGTPLSEFTATTAPFRSGGVWDVGRSLPGDLVDFFIATSDDTTITVPTFSQSAYTFGTAVEYPAIAGIDTSGADGAYDGGYRICTGGSYSGSTANVSATLATAETGTVFATRLRVSAAVAATPPYTSPYPPLLAQ